MSDRIERDDEENVGPWQRERTPEEIQARIEADTDGWGYVGETEEEWKAR